MVFCFNAGGWFSAEEAVQPRYPPLAPQGDDAIYAPGPTYLCQCPGCSRVTRPVIAQLAAETSEEAASKDLERRRHALDHMPSLGTSCISKWLVMSAGNSLATPVPI